jgi:hypothetical protein
MQILAPSKSYNFEKLKDEIEGLAKYSGYFIGNEMYLIVEDDASQPEIDAILSVFTDHDPSPTESQISENTLKVMQNDRQTSFKVLIIGNTFDNAIKARFGTLRPNATQAERQAELEARYTIWRNIFDTQPNLFKGLLYEWWLFQADPSHNLFAPPKPMTNEYMLEFNRMMSTLSLYIGVRNAL